MEKKFKFRVKNLSFGWCRVVMLINDKRIEYNASYLGPNPLATFIDACADLMDDDGKYYITWVKEPGTLDFEMLLDQNRMLHFDIIDSNHKDDVFHEVIPFGSFVDAIISEGFRVLNAFGLYGYKRSWQNDEDFPLTNLLRITGKCKEIWKGDSCCTDISKEIEILQQFITQSRKMQGDMERGFMLHGHI